MLPRAVQSGRVESARAFGLVLLDSVGPLATQDPDSPDPVRMAPAREHVVVMALAMSAFVLNLNANVMGALLPFVRDELGFAGSDQARVVMAAGIGSAIGAFAVADFGRWWGRRTLLAVSLALFLVGSLLHPFAWDFWSLFVLRCVTGFASGLAYATASTAVADLAPYQRRAAVMSRFNVGLFLAVPIGLPLAAWLAGRDSWRTTFVVQAGIATIALVLSHRCVPPLPKTPAVRRWPLLRNGGVLAVLLATMLHVGSFFTVVQLATSWLDDAGIVAKEQQLWIWVGLGLLSVVGSAVFGRFADRIGKRAFVLMTSAVLVVCFVLMSREPGPTVLLATACVLAVAAAARTGPLQALVSGLVPSEQLGALMGLRGFCMQAGVGAFAFGASAITDALGFRGVLMLAAGCQFLSYLAIRLGVRTEPGTNNNLSG